jgi:hypothetical protein
VEKEGLFWGPPADDGTAITELQRLRNGGAAFIAFSWHAFWWFDYYKGFLRHLHDRYVCALKNERLVVFDLRPGAAKETCQKN